MVQVAVPAEPFAAEGTGKVRKLMINARRASTQLGVQLSGLRAREASSAHAASNAEAPEIDTLNVTLVAIYAAAVGFG
eukprot:4075000-Prymnesium_polylepis.1